MGPAPRRRRKPGPSLREVSNVFFQCRDRRRPVLSPNLHSSRVCRYNIGWWHRHGAAHGTGSAALATSDKTSIRRTSSARASPSPFLRMSLRWLPSARRTLAGIARNRRSRFIAKGRQAIRVCGDWSDHQGQRSAVCSANCSILMVALSHHRAFADCK